MKRFFVLLVLVCCWTAGAPAQASNTTTDVSFKGFIEIEAGRSLYIDWKKAAPGAPTIVLLHGLTYNIASWNQLVAAAAQFNYGILRYDPTGMGETLLLDQGVHGIVRIEDQARDLDLLTKKIGLRGKLNLVGLSYGGGLAIAFARDYAERVDNAILMAPFTEPLKGQDTMIRSQIAWTRLTFPLNPASDDDLYAYFLRQNVFYVYPLTEPSMLENSYKPEAVFQMTQGIRKFDAYKASQKFPAASVHLVIAGQDQYIERPVMEKFWSQVPEKARASKLVILRSEHKIPESQPEFAAAWINAILGKSKDLAQGRSFTGDPRTGEVEVSSK